MIDIARFYGIALVYYGYFIERIMYLRNPAAAAHYKCVYSFHMLLFFVLAGYIAKESDLQFSFGKYLKHRLASRLIPFVFFTGLMMVLTLFFAGDFFDLKLPSLNGYLQGLKLTVFGLPMFNIPTWFLLCLNGIFYHFINGRAAQWVVDNLPGSPWVIFCLGSLMTIFSLVLCFPLIYFFNKVVPQLVGKPKIRGPLLRNLT